MTNGKSKNTENWTRKSILNKSSKKIAHISYKTITHAEYHAGKLQRDMTRLKGFGHKSIVIGGEKHITVSGVLRRRKPGSARESLSKFNVVNPGFTQPSHKSHFFPDVFGGPNKQENLSNEEPRMNLSGHKVIENRIGRLMEDAHPGAHTLKRRGSMEVEGSFSASGESQSRKYHIHIDGNGTTPDTFHQITLTRKK
ncbi:hypothetical protein [Undibacterium crateris]|uniref:hypothetical protein n=1 Tax=Undibacterium crateris TaxID=2528175 RepID=UPI0013897D5C|nr:hypothetical protein [Undibacterium crateris]NDI84147.1 hypothetical protein [Undibacterium crateris]